MKQQQVIDSFIAGHLSKFEASNLVSCSGLLKSYETIIAQWVNNNNVIILNQTRYSQSASRIQNKLTLALVKSRITHDKVTSLVLLGVPRGCTDLKLAALQGNYEKALSKGVQLTHEQVKKLLA